VSLDEAFAYAGALGVHPARLIAPRDNTPVNVFPGEPAVEGHIFRAWLRAHAYVRPDDVDYLPAGVDAEEWISRWKWTIYGVVDSTQRLINALEEAIDPDSEAAEVVRDRMAAANEELQGLFRVMAERDDHRPVGRRRIHRAA